FEQSLRGGRKIYRHGWRTRIAQDTDSIDNDIDSAQFWQPCCDRYILQVIDRYILGPTGRPHATHAVVSHLVQCVLQVSADKAAGSTNQNVHMSSFVDCVVKIFH